MEKLKISHALHFPSTNSLRMHRWSKWLTIFCGLTYQSHFFLLCNCEPLPFELSLVSVPKRSLSFNGDRKCCKCALNRITKQQHTERLPSVFLRQKWRLSKCHLNGLSLILDITLDMMLHDYKKYTSHLYNSINIMIEKLIWKHILMLLTVKRAAKPWWEKTVRLDLE